MSRRGKIIMVCVCMIAGAIAVSIVLLGQASDNAKLTVNHIETTNFFDDIHLAKNAVFELSNASSLSLHVLLVPEVKQPDWPVYGATNPLFHPYRCALAPGEVTNVAVRQPGHRRTWRVRIDYGAQATKWDQQRYAWADSLRQRKLSWLAKQVTPIRKFWGTNTSEMKD